MNVNAKNMNSFFGTSVSVDSNEEREFGNAMVHHHIESSSLLQCNNNNNEDEYRIPTTLHFIWFGDTNNLPFCRNSNDSHSPWNDCMASWQKHHEQWNIKVWTERDLHDCTSWIINKEPLDHALQNQHYGMASDIWRLEILYRLGGVHVDVDYMCKASVADLNTRYEFYVGASHTGRVELNNGVIASQAGHWLVRDYMMASIQTWWQHYSATQSAISSSLPFLDKASFASLKQATTGRITDTDIIQNTGPGLLTKTVGNVLLSRQQQQQHDVSRIGVLPYTYFHPLDNRHAWQGDWRDLDHCTTTDTRAIHLWARSWQQELNNNVEEEEAA